MENFVNEPEYVRHAVLSYPNINSEFLDKIVKTAAATITYDSAQLIVNNPNILPSTIDYFAKTIKDRDRLFLIAKNKTVVLPETLDYLAKTAGWVVQYAVLSNNRVMPETLDWLIKKDLLNTSQVELIFRILQNPNTLSSTLDYVAKNSKNTDLIGYAIKHPNITELTLDFLSRSEEVSIRSEVARNPKISSDIFNRLARDKVPYVRSYIVANPKVSPGILDYLGRKDISLSVRWAVAYHALNTPIETLEYMAKHDPDSHLRDTIKDVISKRQEREKEPFIVQENRQKQYINSLFLTNLLFDF